MARKLLYLFILLAMVASLSGCANSSDPDIVFRAYSQAVLEPETFDEYAGGELSPRSDQFFRCLSDVEKALVKAHTEAAAHCDGLPVGYQDYCRQTDASAMSGALSTIASVVRHEASWSETRYGFAAILGKSLVPEFYVSAQRAVIEVYKPVLTCK